MSYDQWKTATPYDHEPDPIEEAERFINAMSEKALTEEKDIQWAVSVIKELLEII